MVDGMGIKGGVGQKEMLGHEHHEPNTDMHNVYAAKGKIWHRVADSSHGGKKRHASLAESHPRNNSLD